MLPRVAVYLAFVVLCTVSATARAETPPDKQSPYVYHPIVDTSIIVGGLALWVVPPLVVPKNMAPSCDPCSQSSLNGFDRYFLGPHIAGARTAANAMLAVPALYVVAELIDVGPKHPASYFTDFGIMVEAVVLNGATQQIVNRAVRRPRPYLYIPGAYPSDRGTTDASASFYSAHTSSVFALATSFSYTFALRHPHSKWKYAVWVASLTVAAIEPVLRVESGDHFVSDVLTGAVVGTAFGLIVPTLHRRPIKIGNAQLAPLIQHDAVGLSLASLF